MSEIVKGLNGRLSNYVKSNNNYYYIDSCNTFDAGLETMIFHAEKIGNEFEVLNWGGIYVEHYKTYKAMKNRHEYLCTHMEEVIK